MSTSRACPACNTPLPEEARFCLQCGVETPVTLSGAGGSPDPEGQAERLSEALAGRYSILHVLGRGGMATVYTAEDQRHHRQVALKVLRPNVATALGPERFLREIEIAARLAHPHIIPVHDSGEADGFLYYVMPLMEGETLRARLVREGELPIPDVIRIVRDVADALAHAHRHGVVHRDIKPDNIMLAGQHALVMDFGVAKAIREAATGERLTTIGVSLGTPAYMAPEQAAGDQQLDHRADIYALGVVAYEVLTGEPPFSGRTPQAVMARHITEEPHPLGDRRESGPEPLASLVMRALNKKAADRWQSADDLLRQLELAATPTGGLTPVSGAQQPVSQVWGRRVALAGTGLALAGILGLAGWLISGQREPGISLSTASFRQLTFTGDVGTSAMSPDGRYIAYTRSPPDSPSQLWVQEVAGTAQALRLAEGSSPVWVKWSPDGSNVFFLDRSETAFGWFTIPLLGGQPRPVAGGAYAGLSSDGSWAAWGVTAVKRVFLKELNSGDTTSVTVDGPITWMLDVEWAPDDGRLALVTQDEERGESSIWTVDVDGSGQELVVRDSTHVFETLQWAHDGDAIYYLRGGGFTAELWEVPVASDGGSAGSPRPVIGGLVPGEGGFSVGRENHSLAYTRAQDRTNFVLYRFDDESREYVREKDLTVGTSRKGFPSISPDGARFAYSDGDGARRNVFLMPIEGGTPRQLTFGDAFIGDPVWSRTGRTLAYAVESSEGAKIWTVSAEGGSPRVFEDTHVSSNTLSVVWGHGESILYQIPWNRSYSVLDPSTGAERPLVPDDSVGWLFLESQAFSPDGSKVIGFWNRRPDPGFWMISVEDSIQRHLWPQEGHLEYWDSDSESVWWHSFEADEIRRRMLDGLAQELTPYPWPNDCPQGGDYTPDKRLVVCQVVELIRDVWLIEDFDLTVR